MTRQDITQKIRSQFGKDIKEFREKSPARVYFDVEKEVIPSIVRFLFRELGARFNIASGIDTPDTIEILYHFTFDDAGLVVSVRTHLDRKQPQIESVTPIMKAAEWIEREIHELLGVEFKNHPNMKPLLLPDNWPKDKFPLRRDFDQGSLEKELDR